MPVKHMALDPVQLLDIDRGSGAPRTIDQSMGATHAAQAPIFQGVTLPAGPNTEATATPQVVIGPRLAADASEVSPEFQAFDSGRPSWPPLGGLSLSTVYGIRLNP